MTEQVGKVATSVVEVMRGAPVILALLIVNAAFLGFAAYLLGEVAANAKERNKEQLGLIGSLIKDIRECHQGPSRTKSILFK